MKIKQTLFTLLLATVLMGAGSTTQAETWECAIIGATQKVILTQESNPALSDNRHVPGTVTGPYGKKYTAEVSIDGFDRRWDYVTADKIGVYAIFMAPSGLAGFYNFSNPEEEVGTREPEYLLFCEEEQSHTESDLKARLLAKENQRRLHTLREAYILAIRQKIESNWVKPAGSDKISPCEVQVTQGPGGIILDLKFGSCGSNNAAYRKSIENAVYKAEPLPRPEDPELFNRNLHILFNPAESSAATIQQSSKRGRSPDEIENVFQKNNGAIFNIYNRALRQNPGLAGKVVVELTIAPNGAVTAVNIVSSELGDEALERRLAARIKKFKFTNADVPEIIVTYPIDFSPS